MSSAILEVTDLSKHFRSRRGVVSALTGQGRVIPAVDGVSFYLKENETVGLVGESGCGKTTVARTVLRLTDPSGGRILFGGRDITHLRRVGIARVLAVRPRLIVADEPTSALDVSIQAQVVNLLRDLQKHLGLAYLFISHDLPVVELVSQKVAVMYLGRIVEMGLAESIAHQPRHPYTRILWSSLADKRSTEVREPRAWGVFDFEQPVSGCRFAPRCPLYQDKGRPAVCTDPASEPPLRDAGKGHVVACHFG